MTGCCMAGITCCVSGTACCIGTAAPFCWAARLFVALGATACALPRFFLDDVVDYSYEIVSGHLYSELTRLTFLGAVLALPWRACPAAIADTFSRAAFAAARLSFP